MDDKKILEQVKTDYNKIADQFNTTRQNNWIEFDLFKNYIINYINNTNIKKINILDVGCGNGRIVNFLNELNIDYNYLGIDNSEEQLKNAKNNFKDFSNINFEIGNILSLEKYNNKFDIVFCIATLHHLPKKFHIKAVGEIKNVVKDGGLMFITNWNLFQSRYFKYLLFNKKEKGSKVQDTFIPWKDNNDKIISNRYYYAFKKKELYNIFKQSKLKIFENKFSENKNIFKARNIVSVLKK